MLLLSFCAHQFGRMLSLKGTERKQNQKLIEVMKNIIAPQECKKCKWASLVALEFTHLGEMGVWEKLQKLLDSVVVPNKRKQKQVTPVRVVRFRLYDARRLFIVYETQRVSLILVLWFDFVSRLSSLLSRFSFLVSRFSSPFIDTSLSLSLLRHVSLLAFYKQIPWLLQQASTSAVGTPISLNATMDQGFCGGIKATSRGIFKPKPNASFTSTCARPPSLQFELPTSPSAEDVTKYRWNRIDGN